MITGQIRRMTGVWLLVAALVGCLSVPALGSCVCSGMPDRCSLRAAVYYGPNEAQIPSPCFGCGECDATLYWPYMGDPEEYKAGKWYITLSWGRGVPTTCGRVDCPDFKRCYRNDTGEMDGPYTYVPCPGERVAPIGLTIDYQGTEWFMECGEYLVYQKLTVGGFEVTIFKEYWFDLPKVPNGIVVGKGVFSGTPDAPQLEYIDMEQDGLRYRQSEVTEAGGDKVLTITKSPKGADAPVVGKTYMRTKLAGDDIKSRRVTIEEYDSKGSKTFETEICRFGSPTPYCKLTPADTARYLADGHLDDGIDPNSPGSQCGLDTVSNDVLDDYASLIYAGYDGSSRVTWLKGSGDGGCCGGSGFSGRKFAYGVAPQGETAWASVRRIQPVESDGTICRRGARRVEFYGANGQLVFEVLQEMSYDAGGDNHTVSKVWITHYVYDEHGYRTEIRHPSACTTAAGYSTSDVNVTTGDTALRGHWVDDVTPSDGGAVGLVQCYEYDSQATGRIKAEWLRQGTSSAGEKCYQASYTYTSTTYAGHTTYRVASETRYPTAWTGTGSAPADREVTTYSYTYYQEGGQDTHAVETRTVTYPAVSVAHNGPGAATQVVAHYKRDTANDLYYNDWTKHEDGTYTYTELGTGVADFGQVVKSIVDANSNAPDVSGFPGGESGTTAWPVRTAGLHLKTAYEYYDDTFSGGGVATYGRLKAVVDPAGKRAFYYYTYQKETGTGGEETTTARVTLVAPHMQSGGPEDGYYNYAPLQITVSDMDGRTVHSAEGTPDDAIDGDLSDDWVPTALAVSDAFQGVLTALTDYTYENDLLAAEDRYHDLAAGHKYRTAYAHDCMGRQYRIARYKGDWTGSTTAARDIAWTEYDQLGRAVENWSGTNDEGAAPGTPAGSGGNNMKKAGAAFYDEATPGSGTSGTGDGRVTSARAYYDAADGNKYVATAYHYNWQGRLRGVEPEAAPYTVQDVDNMGRVVATAQYKANVTWTGGGSSVIADEDYAATVPSDPVTGAKRGMLSRSYYDEMGRVHRTESYAVYQSGANEGQEHDKLVSDNYFDACGRQAGVASLGRGGTEYAFDGAGRQTEVRSVVALESSKYSGTVFQYRDPQPGATSGGNEGVIQISRTYYDDGVNPTRSVTLEVNHDDTDGLCLTVGQEDFVQAAQYAWHDKVHRRVASVAYGCDDPDNHWIYAQMPSWSEGPPQESGAWYLVTRYAYNPAGWMETTVDPAGAVTKRFFDDLGRAEAVVENYRAGGDYWTAEPLQPKSRGADVCRVTAMTYDGLSNVLTRVAVDPNHDGNTADNQTTTYAFGDDYNASLPTRIKYPDGDDADNNVKMEYYLDGAVKSRTAQKKAGETATAIAFSYDDEFHRLVKQSATAAGTNVDQTVLAIGYSYDPLARAEKLTSYNHPTLEQSANVVNQVQYAYSDLGLVATEYQEHKGKVSTGTTAKVGYAYHDAALAGVYTKGLRLKRVTYPNGRLAHYRYGAEGSRDEMISRLSTIHDDATGNEEGLPGQIVASYAWCGMGRMATETFNQAQVRLDYFQDSSGAYAGLDRFGRVKDQRWRYTGATPDERDRYQYGFDYSSNPLYRGNRLTTGQDWDYGYDSLNRLVAADRGLLDDLPLEGLLSTNFRQAWGLDQVGNWHTFQWDSNGADPWDVTQNRDHNLVNEITDISDGAGDWIDPAYDAKGNMTAAPMPGDEAAGTGTQLDLIYDAWNRLVKVVNHGTSAVLGEYRYDGLNRRVRKYTNPNGDNWTVQEFYYNASWQALEVRKDTRSRAGGIEPDVATRVDKQYVWSARYIDSPVLRDRDADAAPETGDLGKADSGLEERLYYLTDANFNVTALVESDGDVAERYVYDPYGKCTINNADWSATVAWAAGKQNEVLYCGYRLDPETGKMDRPDHAIAALYHVRYRPYHVTLGRWNLWDHIGYGDGMNLYEYCRSSVTGVTDPYGLWTIMREGKAKAIAIAGVGDTIKSLADEIGLDPNEAGKWISFPLVQDPRSPAKATTWAVPVTPTGSIDVTAVLTGCEQYSIPNTVIAYWGGFGDDFGKWWVYWNENVRILGKRGFLVNEYDAKDVFLQPAWFREGTDKHELHGFYFWGHGSQIGLWWNLTTAKTYTKEYYDASGIGRSVQVPAPGYTDSFWAWQKGYWYGVNYAELASHLQYRMGLVALFACETDNPNAKRLAHDGPNSVFWGHKGTLVPGPFIGHFNSFDMILPAGKQGTRK